MKIDTNIFEKISGKGLKIGIVMSTWNHKITNSLYSSAKITLEEKGVHPNDISVMEVPGSFELIYGAKKMAKNKNLDAIIVFGSVIKGETPHFDFICSSVFKSILDLSINYNKPIGNGIITALNISQAKNRSMNNKKDKPNKGSESANALIMVLENEPK